LNRLTKFWLSQHRPVKLISMFLKSSLQRHFYTSAKRPGRKAFIEKITEMQKFFGLNVTGILNTETMNVMKSPRCGIPDVAEFSLFPGRPKWNKRHLTYRILNGTPRLKFAVVVDIIKKAFKVWSDVTPLTFTRIHCLNAVVDIIIKFASRAHGDGSPFDGPNGTLAHAYAPGKGIGGDAHFDNDEQWSIAQPGIDLFLVAVHEFGHSLGLGHSADPKAIMFPIYNFVEPFKLSRDDIKGIRILYAVLCRQIGIVCYTKMGQCIQKIHLE
uniref:Peptidase metallopeptidase domain-containing protein n=1 Tax=Leptobrachium leishanense TaxID=445787 RepID=A0A8C5WFC9_9ANUR